jgi:hypothetical protein
LTTTPAAGQRHVKPPTAREGPVGTADGATGAGAGADGGTPATGTTPAEAAVTGGAAAEAELAAGTPACVADGGVGTEPAGVGADPAGATVSNIGAAAGAEWAAGGADAVADAAAAGRGCPAVATGAWVPGDNRKRCPGQMVYGSAIWFHCARSRKSTPLRKAIEYSVSPLSTVYMPPGIGVRATVVAAAVAGRCAAPAVGSITTELRSVPHAASTSDAAAGISH